MGPREEGGREEGGRGGRERGEGRGGEEREEGRRSATTLNFCAHVDDWQLRIDELNSATVQDKLCCSPLPLPPPSLFNFTRAALLLPSPVKNAEQELLIQQPQQMLGSKSSKSSSNVSFPCTQLIHRSPRVRNVATDSLRSKNRTCWLKRMCPAAVLGSYTVVGCKCEDSSRKVAAVHPLSTLRGDSPLYTEGTATQNWVGTMQPR